LRVSLSEQNRGQGLPPVNPNPSPADQGNGVRAWERSHEWKPGSTNDAGGSTLSSDGIATSRIAISSP
jgi:hypothetical protein